MGNAQNVVGRKNAPTGMPHSTARTASTSDGRRSHMAGDYAASGFGASDLGGTRPTTTHALVESLGPWLGPAVNVGLDRAVGGSQDSEAVFAAALPTRAP